MEGKGGRSALGGGPGQRIQGYVSLYVYQDFGAQVLVYNMIQDIRNSKDKEAAATGRENGSKSPMLLLRGDYGPFFF